MRREIRREIFHLLAKIKGLAHETSSDVTSLSYLRTKLKLTEDKVETVSFATVGSVISNAAWL